MTKATSSAQRHAAPRGAFGLWVWLGLTIAMMPASLWAQKFQQEYGNPRKEYLETSAALDHLDSHYCLHQPATLLLTARAGGAPVEGVWVRYRKGPEMLLPTAWDSVCFEGGEARIPMGTLDVPGFLACQYDYTLDGRRHSDLVKAAYAPERIVACTQEPADFDKFWQKAIREARRVPLDVEYFDVPDATDDRFETKLVHLRVGKDKWMWGYLTRPLDGRKHPVVLTPPGAGSQKISPSDYFPREGFIYLKIEIHGNDQRLPDAEYNETRQHNSDGYMRRGITSANTYYYKDVYAGCVRAVDFLCSLDDWDGQNVIVTGGSQGGALTIVTSALSERVTLCAPFYPALSDLCGFRHGRAGGWPKFFSGTYRDGQIDGNEDAAAQTLQYYDVVNFARRLRIPSFWSWGYSDDTCSPTSVWAAWNVVTAPKTQDVTPTSGHWRYASSQAKCLAWMKSLLR